MTLLIKLLLKSLDTALSNTLTKLLIIYLIRGTKLSCIVFKSAEVVIKFLRNKFIIDRIAPIADRPVLKIRIKSPIIKKIILSLIKVLSNLDSSFSCG